MEYEDGDEETGEECPICGADAEYVDEGNNSTMLYCPECDDYV